MDALLFYRRGGRRAAQVSRCKVYDLHPQPATSLHQDRRLRRVHAEAVRELRPRGSIEEAAA